MPNWCANLVSISGEEDQMTKFKNDAKTDKDVLSFEKMLPCPENEDGYNWRIANWGTKWDIDNTDTEILFDSPYQLILRFITAWAPPEEFFNTISKRYPDLYFTCVYAEPGMDFDGMFSFGNENLQWDRDIFIPSPVSFTVDGIYSFTPHDRL